MICGFFRMKGGIWETNCQLYKTGTGWERDATAIMS